MVNQLPVNDDQQSVCGERKDAREREVTFGRVFCGALLSIRHLKKKKKKTFSTLKSKKRFYAILDLFPLTKNNVFN